MVIPRNPIAQFMQEHDRALIQLKQLNKAVTAFSQNGFSLKQYNQIKVALKFIGREVHSHNLKEEKALFPILERRIAGPTRLMRAEHKKLQTGFLKLSKAVDRVYNNKDSFSAIKNMTNVAKNVAQLFVNHLHTENYILFPLIQEFMSKDELAEIAKKMA